METDPNFRREIRFEPGYDHRSDGRGWHGLQIRFLLHGHEGIVQFLVYTDWLPSWVTEGSWGPTFTVQSLAPDLFPMAADLGYHWSTPRYDEQTSMECDLLPGGKCFYDGSGLNAENVMAVLLTGGHDAVWTHLENYYQSIRGVV